MSANGHFSDGGRSNRRCPFVAVKRTHGRHRGNDAISPQPTSSLSRDSEKGLGFCRALSLLLRRQENGLALEIHTAHSAAALRHASGTGVLLRNFGHHGFGGDQESRNRSRVLDRHTDNL